MDENQMEDANGSEFDEHFEQCSTCQDAYYWYGNDDYRCETGKSLTG